LIPIAGGFKVLGNGANTAKHSSCQEPMGLAVFVSGRETREGKLPKGRHRQHGRVEFPQRYKTRKHDRSEESYLPPRTCNRIRIPEVQALSIQKLCYQVFTKKARIKSRSKYREMKSKYYRRTLLAS
jgi:hypothetical protein